MVVPLVLSLVIIGDSIAASSCGWPQLLAQHGIPIHNQSQPGRSWHMWEPPADLYPWKGERDIIIALGDNDVIWGYVAHPWWESRKQHKIRTLEDRGWTVHLLEYSDVETSDGVHPTCKGHTTLAWEIYWKYYEVLNEGS